MANLYYREDLAGADVAAGDSVEFSGDEARHAVRVSRLRVGERTLVGDGAGTIAQAEVTLVDRDRFAVRIESARFEPPAACELVLVQALAKGDRDERAVEQATEFGVDRIVPWQAERSVSRWGADRVARGVAKWQRIAREAAKQSVRARIPLIDSPVSLAELAARAREPHTEVLALHPRGTQRLSEWAQSLSPDGPRQIWVVIGPEGGFSDAELETLRDAGARVLQLGQTVLRTSSAGPAALALLNGALGRW